MWKIFLKILKRIQTYEDAPFLDPKWFICPKQEFLEKITNIIFIYLLTPFIMQNFFKIVTADPDLWGCTIYGPKIAHLLKADNYVLMKYWNLIDQE